MKFYFNVRKVETAADGIKILVFFDGTKFLCHKDIFEKYFKLEKPQSTSKHIQPKCSLAGKCRQGKNGKCALKDIKKIGNMCFESLYQKMIFCFKNKYARRVHRI